jgi:trehalose 6-phosphate synthase/phosphatase
MKLIIVSNRLPFTLEQKESGAELKPSMGGVATGLYSYLSSLNSTRYPDRRVLWFGSSTKEIDDDYQEELRELPFEHINIVLDAKLYTSFYTGFCNQSLYPLLTGFPQHFQFTDSAWNCYIRVNRMFAQRIATQVEPGDIVWVNDYHFFLLPALLRELIPKVTINFFLHVPFPSSDTFAHFPNQVSKTLLEGVLSANMVGFHIQEYVDNFTMAAKRISTITYTDNFILHNGGKTKICCYPMSIDFNKYHQASRDLLASRINQEPIQSSKIKTLLSVDRLDYTKGITNKLWAYEFFLERYTDWRGKVSFTVVIAPSRMDVSANLLLKKQIEEQIENLNSKYSTNTCQAVNYYFEKFEFQGLVEHYLSADVAIVTPIKDGMNLVAKEFIASRVNSDGALILSKEAGARYELCDAFIVDPANISDIAQAMNDALMLNNEEQRYRMVNMQEVIKKYDIFHWVSDVLEELPGVFSDKDQSNTFNAAITSEISNAFFSANKRIFFLDYDGTLSNIHENPENAMIEPNLLASIRVLASYTDTKVIIVSGRRAGFIEESFREVSIDYAAEYGSVLRKSNNKIVSHEITDTWKPTARTILEKIMPATGETVIEEKDFSMVIHFKRNSLKKFDVYLSSLLKEFKDISTLYFLEIVQAKTSFEIKPVSINKGKALGNWLYDQSYDFIFAAGDDESDEEMFKMLPSYAYSVRIGDKSSHAKYISEKNAVIIDMLKKIASEINSGVLAS